MSEGHFGIPFSKEMQLGSQGGLVLLVPLGLIESWQGWQMVACEVTMAPSTITCPPGQKNGPWG